MFRQWLLALLPAQVEEDVDLAQMLPEVGTLLAIVTPIHNPQEARVMLPAEYRPPEAPTDVFVAPAGPADDDRRPPTGLVGYSPIALAAPAVPTLERNLLFPGQTWLGQIRRIIDCRWFTYRLVRQLCLNPWAN